MRIEEIHLPDGQVWQAFSQGLGAALIAIPIDQLANLTPEEIGHYVLASTAFARECRLIELIENGMASIDEYETEEDHQAFIEAYQKANLAPAPYLAKISREGFVYVIGSDSQGVYKIGCTKYLSNRIANISPKLPFPIAVIKTFACSDMFKAEAFLHHRFDKKRTFGEWFQLDKSDLAWLQEVENLDGEVKQ